MGCVVFCFVVRISVYVAKQKEQQLAVTCLDLRCLVFFFRTHPRLNLGCVLVFLLVCLCAHLRLNLGCVVFVFVRIPVSTWGAFWFFFCVSLCAPPSQPGVRSFCFCAHLRLNLGCVVFFLCASPSQPGMRGDMQEQHHRHKHKHIRRQSGSTLWRDTCPYQNGGFTHR